MNKIPQSSNAEDAEVFSQSTPRKVAETISLHSIDRFQKSEIVNLRAEGLPLGKSVKICEK
jgi:hypothetical protein